MLEFLGSVGMREVVSLSKINSSLANVKLLCPRVTKTVTKMCSESEKKVFLEVYLSLENSVFEKIAVERISPK